MLLVKVINLHSRTMLADQLYQHYYADLPEHLQVKLDKKTLLGTPASLNAKEFTTETAPVKVLTFNI